MEFDFLKEEYEEIVDKLMLKDNQLGLDKILEMKIKRYSIVQIALELNIGESTVSKRVNMLKKMIKKLYR